MYSVYLIHQKHIFLFREDDTADQDNLHSDGFSPEAVDSNNAFGDDMLQMALKMATGELDEPAVDLEAALTPNTITATQAPSQPETAMDNDGMQYIIQTIYIIYTILITVFIVIYYYQLLFIIIN